MYTFRSVLHRGVGITLCSTTIYSAEMSLRRTMSVSTTTLAKSATTRTTTTTVEENENKATAIENKEHCHVTATSIVKNSNSNSTNNYNNKVIKTVKDVPITVDKIMNSNISSTNVDRESLSSMHHDKQNDNLRNNVIDNSLLYYRRLTGRLLYYVYVDGAHHLDISIASHAKKSLLDSIIAARKQDTEMWEEEEEELEEQEQERELLEEQNYKSEEVKQQMEGEEKDGNVESKEMESQETQVKHIKKAGLNKKRVEAARLINTLIIFIRQENTLEKLLNSSSTMTKMNAQSKQEANADIRLSQVERQILLEKVCDVVEQRQVSLTMASRLLRSRWPRFLLSGTAEAQHQFIIQSILSWLSEELRSIEETNTNNSNSTNSNNKCNEGNTHKLDAHAARILLDNLSFTLRSSIGYGFIGPLANLAISDLHSITDPNALISLMYSVYVSHGKAPSSFWEQIVERLIVLNNTLREGVEDVLNESARTQHTSRNMINNNDNNNNNNSSNDVNRKKESKLTRMTRKDMRKKQRDEQLDEEDKNETEWNDNSHTEQTYKWSEFNEQEDEQQEKNKDVYSSSSSSSTSSSSFPQLQPNVTVTAAPSAGHVFSGLTTRQIFRLLNILRKQHQWTPSISHLHELCDQALKNIVFEMEAAGFATERSLELSKNGIYRRIERVSDLNAREFVELLTIAGELSISFTTSGNRVADLLLAPLVPHLDRQLTLLLIHAVRFTRCQSVNLYNVLVIEIWRRGYGAPYTLILTKSLLRSLLKETELFTQVQHHDLISFFYELCELCVRRVHSGELLSMAEILYGISRRFATRSSHGLRIRAILDLFCKQYDRLMQLELLSLYQASRLLEYTVVLGMRNDALLYPGTARLIATREVVYKRTQAEEVKYMEQEYEQGQNELLVKYENDAITKKKKEELEKEKKKGEEELMMMVMNKHVTPGEESRFNTTSAEQSNVNSEMSQMSITNKLTNKTDKKSETVINSNNNNNKEKEEFEQYDESLPLRGPQKWETMDESHLPRISRAALNVYNAIMYVHERLDINKAKVNDADIARLNAAFEKSGLYNIFLGAFLMKEAHLVQPSASPSSSSSNSAKAKSSSSNNNNNNNNNNSNSKINELYAFTTKLNPIIESIARERILSKLSRAKINASSSDEELIHILGQVHVNEMKLRKFIALIQHSPLQQCKTQRVLWLYVTELVKRFGNIESNNNNSVNDVQACVAAELQMAV